MELNSPGFNRMSPSRLETTLQLARQRSLVSKRSGSNLSISFMLPKKDDPDGEMEILDASAGQGPR